jgi:formylglycine-generating enzyme
MTAITRRLAAGVVLLSWSWLPGCGGDSAPAPGGGPAEQGAAAKGADPAPAAKADGAVADGRQPRESAVPSEVPGALPPAWGEPAESATSSRFGIMRDPAEGGARFTVDEQENPDRFVAVVPDRGVDASRFLIAGKPASAAASAGANQAAAPRSLPEGFEPVPGTGTDAGGLPRQIRCLKDDSLMALVPEGTFLQGANHREPNAGPQLSVFLDAYYIDVNEVTVAQYDRYRDEQRLAKKRYAEPARSGDRASEPVLGLSWTEARAYALRMQKDLPTEAEWEKAARGPEGFAHPWGNGPSVWHRERRVGQIDPVGSFRGDRSPFGVNDLAGNAREWCADYYAENYYEQLAQEGGATIRNPTGPRPSGGSTLRVVKGGNEEWFAWARAGINQNERPQDVGFRCVLRLRGAK